MFSIVFSPIEKKITVFSNELFIVNCFRLPADLQLYPKCFNRSNWTTKDPDRNSLGMSQA